MEEEKEPNVSDLLEEIEEEFKSPKKYNFKSKQNKQVMWAIALMAVIILVIVLVPYITANFVNKFVYLNLDFQKTKLGELIFYSTKVPVIDDKNQITNVYTMNFRNDPRKLEKILFNHTNDASYVYFSGYKAVYITLDQETNVCEDTGVAIIPFAGFLKDFALRYVKSGITDENYAMSNNLSYVTCQNSPNNTVIYIHSGEETKIEKLSRNCYELTYKNCEITKVTEKFELIMLDKYMSYFTRNDGSLFDSLKFWESPE